MKPFQTEIEGLLFLIEPVAKPRKTLRFERTGERTLRVTHPTCCSRQSILRTLDAHPRMVRRMLDAWSPPPPTPSLSQAQMRAWLHEATQKVQSSLSDCTQLTGLAPSYVKLKELRSIWGSCTGKNGINLNIRLCYCPESVLRYVILHELCHLRHRNHGPDFWALVGRYDPRYKAHRDFLKTHQGRILGLPLGLPLDGGANWNITGPGE